MVLHELDAELKMVTSIIFQDREDQIKDNKLLGCQFTSLLSQDLFEFFCTG